MRQPAVYIMASAPHGTLYTGVTKNLIARVFTHKEGVVPGFTQKYDIKLLVYYELHDTMNAAIEREKQIKRWDRAWKVELIQKENPRWIDLYPVITGEVQNEEPPSVPGTIFEPK